jgi:outer membrane protein W
MRTGIRGLGLAAALSLLAAGSALAQQGGLELGFDMQFAYVINDQADNVFRTTMPIGGTDVGTAQGGFRLGYFFNDQVSIEPSLCFGLVSRSDETDVNLGFATLLLYHFTTDPTRIRGFVALGPNVTLLNTADTQSQFGATAELGGLFPLMERLAARASVGGAHFFENNNFNSRWSVFSTLGLSFFTK